MQDQMTVTAAFNALTEHIESVETKPYMRELLRASLTALDFPPDEVNTQLEAVYGPRTLQ